MSDIPTCHPGTYRGGRGIPFSKLAVGEVFHGVGDIGKLRTYVKVCPEHAVAISHVPAEDVEAIRMDCARDHVLYGRRDLARSLSTFEEESRVRPVGKRLFVPDAEAEANWKEHAETVAKMMARSMKEDGSG